MTEGETVGSSLRTVQHIFEFICGRLLHSCKHVLVGVCCKLDSAVSPSIKSKLDRKMTTLKLIRSSHEKQFSKSAAI